MERFSLIVSLSLSPMGLGPPEEAAEDSESTWRFSDDNIKHKYKSESITAENDEVEDKMQKITIGGFLKLVLYSTNL